MKLDLSSREQAIGSLNKAVERTRQDLKDEEARDAVIQRCDDTYELCWKMLKRQLEQDVPNPSEIDQLSFRGQRNGTSQPYNRQKAESVYQTAVQFLPDARALLEVLKRRSS